MSRHSTGARDSQPTVDVGAEGGCTCGALRYRLTAEPVALVACHCTECQTQSGSAFGLSLLVPREGFELLAGETRRFERPAASGRTIGCVFCTDCGTRIYHEPQYNPAVYNVKAGTLDDTSRLRPSLHVWTRSKQPWFELPDDVRCCEEQPV